jgi:hypothetical protein
VDWWEETVAIGMEWPFEEPGMSIGKVAGVDSREARVGGAEDIRKRVSWSEVGDGLSRRLRDAFESDRCVKCAVASWLCLEYGGRYCLGCPSRCLILYGWREQAGLVGVSEGR